MNTDMNELTAQQKAELFRSIANDPVKRSEYISTRALQIQPLIDKESQVRGIFTPERLAPGANPSYPIGSTEVQTAWIAGSIGSAPRRIVEGDEVFVNTFNLFARAEWSMDLANDGRWQVAAESQFYMASQLKELENLVGWQLIRNALAHNSFPSSHTIQIGNSAGVDVTTGQGFFSKQFLGELILAGDVARRRITDVYVSPRTMYDMFVYWTGSLSGTNQMPESMQSQFMTRKDSGTSDAEFVVNVFGVNIHKVYDSTVVDDETVYAFDLSNTRSRFGVMPIRQDVVTYEDPMAVTEFKVGYFGRERLGMAILDHRCAFKGIINRS